MKISVSEENSEKKKENREKSKAYHSKFWKSAYVSAYLNNHSSHAFWISHAESYMHALEK